MNVKTLARCFKEKIEEETSNFADTVEEKIQNAVLLTLLLLGFNEQLGQKTHLQDEMRPVLRYIQSVGNMYILLLLLKTRLETTTYYMYQM